jgi:hypothetical protein
MPAGAKGHKGAVDLLNGRLAKAAAAIRKAKGVEEEKVAKKKAARKKHVTAKKAPTIPNAKMVLKEVPKASPKVCRHGLCRRSPTDASLARCRDSLVDCKSSAGSGAHGDPPPSQVSKIVPAIAKAKAKNKTAKNKAAKNMAANLLWIDGLPAAEKAAPRKQEAAAKEAAPIPVARRSRSRSSRSC